MVDRLERLVNLTATLLDTRRPITLDEIAERIEPSYPEEKGSRRRQFERDKETLRELGIPISVETPDGFGSDQAYRILADDYYLPDLGLTDDELAALHVAITAVRLEGDDARDALRKLGGVTGEGADAAFADLPVTPALSQLFDAASGHAPVTFSYRGEPRRLEPYGVVLRWGHWYVVGRDEDRDAPRAFRVDRIDGAIERRPRRRLHAATRHRSAGAGAQRSAHVRGGPTRRRAGPRRPAARRVGDRPVGRERGGRASK